MVDVLLALGQAGNDTFEVLLFDFTIEPASQFTDLLLGLRRKGIRQVALLGELVLALRQSSVEELVLFAGKHAREQHLDPDHVLPLDAAEVAPCALSEASLKLVDVVAQSTRIPHHRVLSAQSAVGTLCAFERLFARRRLCHE